MSQFSPTNLVILTENGIEDVYSRMAGEQLYIRVKYDDVGAVFEPVDSAAVMSKRQAREKYPELVI